MIVSRTPYRVSFFGGGSDYPAHYLRHGGRVLGTAINKYCYLSVRRLPPFFAHRHRIVYSRTELPDTVDQIQHPAVRETMRHLGIDYGVTVLHDGDIPASSGVGTSSSFTVGLLHALLALEGRMATRQELAAAAIHVEQNRIGEHVGSQDQTFAAHGGLNTIDFLPNGEIAVRPVILPPARLADLEQRLLLVFSGFSRNAPAIAGEQVRRIRENRGIIEEMQALVPRALDLLCSEADLGGLGALLEETWRLKRRLADNVTTPQIEALHAAALRSGARGGKLLGAGGGGCLLFVVEPEARARVVEALAGCVPIPFACDFDGSRIVVYEPHQ